MGADVQPMARERLPAPEPIDGCAILDDLHRFTGRFIAYPHEYAHDAHVLWVGHTHAMDAWDSTARLAFLSPEPASGKSRALEITALLVPRPVEAVNVSAAYLFRKIDSEDGRPTILFDEIDAIFGTKAQGDEDLRALLNAGHRRHSTAGRCEVQGRKIVTVDFPAYAAVALAGLGDIPDTVRSRSIVVLMRRRAPTEPISAYRRRLYSGEGLALAERLALWADSIGHTLREVIPDMPRGVEDRDADVWEPLLAVADAAGGDWPARARRAARFMVAESQATPASLGVQLLADVQRVFGDGDQLSTETLLSRLHELEDGPWADLRGRALDARGLSSRLKPYGVAPCVMRFRGGTARGYRRSDLADAWTRYLTPPKDVTGVTGVTDVPEVWRTYAAPSLSATAVWDASRDVAAAKPRTEANVSPVTSVTPLVAMALRDFAQGRHDHDHAGELA